ncbi:MAG: hypothetical protein ABIP19_02985 [Dermatophilaceae bacterium]
MRPFADAQAGAAYLPPVDLAGEVDGAQGVINAASVVRVMRVAQHGARDQRAVLRGGGGADLPPGPGRVLQSSPLVGQGPEAVLALMRGSLAIGSRMRA